METRSSLSGSFWLMLFHEVTVRCWQGQVICSLSGMGEIYFSGGPLVLAVGKRSLSSLPRGPLHGFVGRLEDPKGWIPSE